MDQKQKFLKIASLVMAVFALIALISSAVNVFTTMSEINNSAEVQSALDTAIKESGDGVVTADMAKGLVGGIAYAGLAVVAVFNILKIIIALLGVKKADKPGTGKFFTVWGVIFLIFGLFGLTNIASLNGICNLMAGVLAPLAYIVFAKVNKA